MKTSLGRMPSGSGVPPICNELTWQAPAMDYLPGRYRPEYLYKNSMVTAGVKKIDRAACC
jgi:hypothetical protein